MSLQISSMLSLWQWAILAAVPPAIVLLYFLKLKRQPLEVPSTYLWLKSIEDLHVNSIWQRLRQSLLLFLQLLLIALLILALWKPSWRGSRLVGNRYIFLIDTSASMAASDVEPTRLDDAKKKVGELIGEMTSGDTAMIISFSDGAKVEQSYTDNRYELRRKLAEIKQTDRPTSVAEALRVASGLANPGRSSNQQDAQDFQVAEAVPATLYIFSDGKFPDVKDFSLGHLTPVYTPIGTETATNLAVAAFTTGRREDQPELLQAFARVENHGLEKAAVDVELNVDGTLLDAKRVEVEPGESTGVAYDLEEIKSGVLKLVVDAKDDLAIDNTAWATINPPRRSKVLFVTPGDEPLEIALSTDSVRELADVVQHSPDYLALPEYAKQAQGGAYDLIIYDRCSPQEPPQANTLYIGSLPPGGAWKAEPKVDVPQIIDTDRAHPLMQIVEMGNVIIVEGTPLVPPPGSTVLVDTAAGGMFAIGPREGYEDAVLGFELIGEGKIGTNWVTVASFPVFVLNALEYLGGLRLSQEGSSTLPGETVVWRSDTAGDQIRVTTPGRSTVEVARTRQSTFKFNGTSEVGIYEVRENSDEVTGRFAVNLFDSNESDIPPRQKLDVGDTEVAGQAAQEPARRDAWKFLLLAALAVLLGEWYIYNRRVYV